MIPENFSDIWITSDTHYMHTNLCKGVTRWKIDTPEKLESVRNFETLEEMNEKMIENINRCVKPNDWLIHDGDWSFGGFDRIEEFRKRINCKNIILYLGNHDHHILKNKGEVRRFFKHVGETGTMKLSEKENILFRHYPIDDWNGWKGGTFLVHGHVHSKGEKRFGKGKFDAGICGSPEYRPYHLDEIVDILRKSL